MTAAGSQWLSVGIWQVCMRKKPSCMRITEPTYETPAHVHLMTRQTLSHD